MVLLFWPMAELGGQALPAQSSDLTLLPGDAIRVFVWREPDLSGEFRVNEDGNVTLPLLGPLRVTGLPMDSVRHHLLERYSEQLRNPAIEITPLRRIHVLGEVRQPGIYAADPTITIGGAVVLAGGAAPDGDLDNITLVREGTIVREGISATDRLPSLALRSGDQIVVRRRGWLSRNSTFVASAVLSVTTFIVSLALR